MKLAICGDHRAFNFKNELIKEIETKLGYECVDCGTFSEERCDYPPLAILVADKVVSGECDYGIAICGSGDGMCMAANKVKGIRCTLVVTKEDAIRAKAHINANVLALGCEKTTIEEALEIIRALIETTFLQGRYKERIEMINEYEKNH